MDDGTLGKQTTDELFTQIINKELIPPNIEIVHRSLKTKFITIIILS